MSNAHLDHQNDLRQTAKLYLDCDKVCGEDVPANVLECAGIVKCCLEKIDQGVEAEDKPELKSCPFCGGEAEVTSSDHYVGCLNPSCWLFGYATSPKAWNTREAE